MSAKMTLFQSIVAQPDRLAPILDAATPEQVNALLWLIVEEPSRLCIDTVEQIFAHPTTKKLIDPDMLVQAVCHILFATSSANPHPVFPDVLTVLLKELRPDISKSFALLSSKTSISIQTLEYSALAKTLAQSSLTASVDAALYWWSSAPSVTALKHLIFTAKAPVLHRN